MIPVLKARARQCVAKPRRFCRNHCAKCRLRAFSASSSRNAGAAMKCTPTYSSRCKRLLAEGCMSTGWMYGVVGCHPYELALFHDKAQAEVWGRRSFMLVSSTYQPVGKVTHVEGGFRLSGRWGFSTGSVHCGWVLLGAFWSAQGRWRLRLTCAPSCCRAATTRLIEDAWHTFGLQGTGSHDIIVDDVFVPEYRTHRSIDGFLCQNPGQEVKPTAALHPALGAGLCAFGLDRRLWRGACGDQCRHRDHAGPRFDQHRQGIEADPILHAAMARAHCRDIARWKPPCG
jgi:3-hydroxy-9,10-secoandrosta-1,3,5(10)-triene-9,17-dione monooxygenase